MEGSLVISWAMCQAHVHICKLSMEEEIFAPQAVISSEIYLMIIFSLYFHTDHQDLAPH